MSRIVRARWLCWLAALITLSPPALAQARWPSLEEAVAVARKGAPSVVVAQVEETVASATRVGAARPSVLNPSLELVGARSRITQGVEVAGTLSQPVEIAGQRSARLESSDRLRAWRGAGVELARAQVVGHVVRAHGEALVAAARLALARRGEDDARAEVAVLEARLSARDTTRHAESIARVELARWEQTRAEAELDLHSALGRLDELLAAGPVGAPGGESLVLPPRPERRDALAIEIAKATPTVAERLNEAAFHEAEIGRHRSERWPAVGLLVTGGRGDYGEARIGGGLSWTLPVFNRGEGPVAVSRESANGARRLASVEQRSAEIRARSSIRTLTGALEALAEVDGRAIPAARAALAAARGAQEAGKADFITVLVARRDLATTETRKLDLAQRAWDAYAELCALAGGLP